MPIEDVSYLLEHSTKDSFMFFVDSNSRDREFFPDASSFIVSFDEPIRFVYGLDILDGAIPNTMYNIDAHNCNMVLMIMQFYETLEDPTPLAGTMMTMLTEQQENAVFAAKFNSNLAEDNVDIYVVDRADWLARPELAVYVASDPVAYIGYPPPAATVDSFFILKSVFAVSLIKLAGVPNGARQALLDDASLTTFGSMGDVYFLQRTEALAALLNDATIDSISVFSTSYVGNVGNVGSSQYSSTYSVTISTNVPVPRAHGGAGYVARSISTHVLTSLTALPFYTLTKRAVEVEVGTYDINTLQTELQAVLSQWDIFLVGTDRAGSTDIQKQGRIKYTHSYLPFVLNMDCSTIFQNIGFDGYATDAPVGGGYIKGSFAKNKRVFGSVWDASSNAFVLKTPGTVNLLGTRYVTLRCKEIEEHLSSAVTYNKYSAGIGVFKLQDINDVSNLRFDFSTFLRKPFHPIGKLSRLTFQFQTPWGDNYDFKGYNHHILISIKYYAPDMNSKFVQSTLNPNYDPDYVKYVSRLALYAQDDEEAFGDGDVEGLEEEEEEGESDNEDVK